MDDKSFLQQVGQNIKRVRKQHNISQRELALRCDYEKTTISRIEAGRTNITLLTMKKLADGIGVQIEDLIKTNL